MKKIISASLALFMSCILFTSCEKNSSFEPEKKADVLSSAANRTAVAHALKTYFEEKSASSANAPASSNGAQFLVPFFTSESVGFGNFDFVNFKLELYAFTADLSGSDFLRKNPDGTYSVHVNSNTALAEYYQNLFDPSALYLYGNQAHFSANYTGELVEMPIYDDEGNVIFVFRFIDTEGSGRAYSLAGNGKIGPDGVAPLKHLSCKVTITPSGQRQIDVSMK